MKDSELNQFRHESLQDQRSIVAYLQAISEGFSSGRLRLGGREGAVDLEPRGMIELEIETSERHGYQQLTLNFSWRNRSADEARLRISGGEGDDAPPRGD